MSLSLSTFTKLLSRIGIKVGPLSADHRSAIGEPRAKGCLARRTFAHNGRSGAQLIRSVDAIGPEKDVLEVR